MFSQYFGNYLLNRGLITRDELYHALEAQQEAHLKLGVLGIGAGLLTSEQVEEIYQEQTRQDKRFGEIAVEKGYLSEEQLDFLLASQKKGHLLLGQALIDAEVLDLAKLEGALKDYQQDYALTDEQFAAVQMGDLDLLLEKTLGTDQGLAEEIKDYLSLFAKNLIRFIDTQAWVEVGNPGDLSPEWFVSQKIAGPIALTTEIVGQEKAFVKLASLFAKETISTMDELGQASVAEFLNLHNGIFLVNMSNQGVELELKPQEIQSGGWTGQDDAQFFKVHLGEEEVNLVLHN